ncbi:Holliday junction resolvase RuvX [Oceanivirga miroungae]|uniref:Putative pre-16S rRNA nuclease n=1 Tax=Oceanivirga miroungae TaxID=1130046 RepID=A0A6I8MES0_9FUSO|nr:Holliday junction resolvase RuvX [Oceanivirga miroungae]VWL85594.1 Holliday junction resolvase YqgF [Oceanivirga miroungae]
MKKYIGIDLGDVRIGVAKCDPLGILATGLVTINREKEDPIKKILEICKEEMTYKIVMGKPLRLNGNSEIQVEKVEKFSEELKKMDSRIEIFYVDERYTTKEAEYYLRNFSKKNAKEKRQVVDMIAATIILQTFLNSLTKN